MKLTVLRLVALGLVPGTWLTARADSTTIAITDVDTFGDDTNTNTSGTLTGTGASLVVARHTFHQSSDLRPDLRGHMSGSIGAHYLRSHAKRSSQQI